MMARTYEEIKELIDAGLGKQPCDRKLANVRLVNVFSGEIYSTNIYIKSRRIVSIDPTAELESKEIIDCHGLYAIPGLIDTHMHFESTMLCPETLVNVVLPKGTTTLCADLMEIANVAGGEGLRAMLQSIDRLPCRMLIEVSSRVPTAPGLETTGAVLDDKAVAEIMAWPESVSLGELDPSKILFPKEEYLRKIEDTLRRRKIVNGHAIGRLGQELNIYASAGISDDHECVEAEEMLARLRTGMRVLIREGSSERNVEKLTQGILDLGLSTDNLMFCTDDKHAHEIQAEGHINYNVHRAIARGIPPMQAIQMATINAARHFRMEDEIGSITPGRLADILLLPDLVNMEPQQVYYEGRLVSQNGEMLERCSALEYPAWIQDSVHLKSPITKKSFTIPAKRNNETTVNVIELIDGQIINCRKTAVLPVREGAIQIDITQDILKLSIVERYGKNGNVGMGFVRGFGLKQGALAYSMAHDHHNIVTVGANESDMAVAVNRVAEMKGGLCVARKGEILAEMCLPIGGLMTTLDEQEVMKQIEYLNQTAKNLGCVLPAPFMTLSFISLPTVPELGLTDKGLVDVLAHCLIDTELA